ncbi:hypothetical protein CIB48_g6507 [Xylaria polymorpha]|nr:hypothetical protein CIB48_g6507 [Xylaria polymorpha]
MPALQPYVPLQRLPGFAPRELLASDRYLTPRHERCRHQDPVQTDQAIPYTAPGLAPNTKYIYIHIVRRAGDPGLHRSVSSALLLFRELGRFHVRIRIRIQASPPKPASTTSLALPSSSEHARPGSLICFSRPGHRALPVARRPLTVIVVAETEIYALRKAIL